MEKQEQEEIAAMRSHALRLLKSKLRRGRGRSDRQCIHTAAPSLGKDTGAVASPARDNDPVVMLEADVTERSSSTTAKLESSNKDCCSAGDILQEETITQLKQCMSATIVSSRQSSTDQCKKPEVDAEPLGLVGENRTANSSTTRLTISTSIQTLTKTSRPPPPPLETQAPELAAARAADHSRPPLKRLVVKWSCTACKRECIPVREESRCLW